MLRIEPQIMLARITNESTTVEQSTTGKNDGTWHLRLTAANNTIRGFVNYELAFEESLSIPAGSISEVIASQLNWQINELLVAGQ